MPTAADLLVHLGLGEGELPGVQQLARRGQDLIVVRQNPKPFQRLHDPAHALGVLSVEPFQLAADIQALRPRLVAKCIRD